ncbi:MAG: flagellin lysine-N-methylase [Lachnospiraceae bacterium]|nr:flagellin lysine-N-methylase [Lachnospiraceae bacterium]
MKLRLPEYFVDFACIGGKCPDSCCVGWELDIDEETYDYYQALPGSFGERLRAAISRKSDSGGAGGVFGLEGDYTFRVPVNGRCPFLNRDNLCDIVLTLGPEALCTVCSEYPRYTFQLGNSIEKSLTLSCPEAGRLIFTMIRPMGFTETDLGESEAGALFDEDGTSGEAFSEEEELFCRAVGRVRDTAIRILSARPRPLSERTACFIRYAERMQELLNDSAYLTSFPARYEEAGAPFEAFLLEPKFLSGAVPDGFDEFEERLRILSGLEVLDTRWEKSLEGLRRMASEGIYAARLDAYRAFRREDPLDDYEFLLCYFVNRYFPRAAYDLNLLSKARLALFGCLTVRDLDAALFHENEGRFSFSDRIRNAANYSREVEHSDENLELIEEELIFN